MGPGGLGLMQAISTLARQLVDGHRGPVKLTGFYAVLQAATGGAQERPKSIIIDCYGAKKTVEEKDLIMAEWGRQQAGTTAAPKATGAGATTDKINPLVHDDGADGNPGSNDGGSGSDEAEAVEIPEMQINSPRLLLSLPTVKKGVMKLSKEDLAAVLSKCGLRSYKQLTYNLVKGIFKKAYSLTIARGVRKGDFAWGLVTPLGLLMNTWSMDGSSVSVDRGSFIPPDSGSGSQRGGIETKRVCLCVAAHICPFWSAILRGYFKDNPVNKIAVAKRFRGADDAFANALGRRGRLSKLRKLSQHAAAEKGSKDEKDEGGMQPEPSEGDNVQSSPGDEGPLPVAVVCLSELAVAVSICSIETLLLLDPSPLLPSTAVLSVASVPAAEYDDICRADNQLRFVLPRELLKRAFHLLGTVNETAGAIDLDGQRLPGAQGAPATSPVLCISVGKNLTVRCSTAGLTHMSAVLGLNEQLKMCADFRSWIQVVRQSTAAFPRELEFLVGARVPVAAAADFIWSSCEHRRVGEPAWQYFLLDAGSQGDVEGSRLYGGCTVSFADVVLGAQRAFMTNAILDAALVEMRQHGALRTMPGYVLLTGQSASFTTCNKVRVPAQVAVKKIKEVYDVMPRARYQRFLMLLNLVDQHWISAEVLPHGVINVFDSSDGVFKSEKDFAVQRVMLFAREVDRLRRLNDRTAPVVDKWTVKFVNSPVQADGYNCGPFALAHIWSAANGMDLCEMTDVHGDHLRLGILFSLLQCGKRYDEQRLATQAARSG